MKKRILSALLAMSVSTLIAAGACCYAADYDPYSEDTNLYTVDFENFTTGETSGHIIDTTWQTEGVFRAEYNFYSSERVDVKKQVSADNPYSNENSAISKGLLGKNEGDSNLFVDEKNGNKRLKVVHGANGVGSGSIFQIKRESAITSGYVRLSFDFEIATECGAGEYGDILNFIDKDTYTLFQNGNIISIKENQNQITLISGATVGTVYSVEILIDLDNDKATVTLTDGTTTKTQKISIPNNNFQTLKFHCRRQAADPQKTMYFDNISVSQPKLPAIESTNIAVKTDEVWNGIIGAELVAPQLQFNLPLTENALSGISFYENDTLVSEPQFALSDDGRTLTVGKTLSYSKPYRIKIGKEAVMAANNLYVPEQTISFHTKHEPAKLTVTDVAFTGGESQTPVSSLDGLSSITVSTAVTNPSESESGTAMLILALYDAEGIMVQADCKEIAVGAAATESAALTMSLPDNTGGYALKAYTWDGFGAMKILEPSRTLGE